MLPLSFFITENEWSDSNDCMVQWLLFIALFRRVLVTLNASFTYGGASL